MIAGAGSGKTRVLTERIARMIESGTAPDSLVVLTFTRRAAGEMRQRLIGRLGGSEKADKLVGRLTMGTFHSVALRILRAHGDRLGYEAASLTVVSPTEADGVMRSIGAELGHYVKAKWKGLSWKKVNDWREAYYTGQENDPALTIAESRALERMLHEYINRLRTAQALDFGLILKEVKRLFETHPDVLAAYHRLVRHVMVDESQDCDSEQYTLHNYFSPRRGGNATLFMVGDRRQSVYGFRGARPDLMTSLYGDAELIDLRECFRCGDEIVERANRLIAINQDPLAKPMIGATATTGNMEAFAGGYDDVVRKVTELRSRFAAHEIAVLARTHRLLKRLQGCMLDREMPCRRVGRTQDINAKDEFLKVHAAMRLVMNRRDNLAFTLLAADLGLDREKLLGAMAHAASMRIPVFESYVQHRTNALGDVIANANPQHGADIFIHTIRHHIASDAPTMHHVAEFWMEFCDGKSIAEALEWYAAFDMDKGDDHQAGDAVTLITAHAAKGLEWPAVILMGLNEGLWPSRKSSGEADGVLEERRLAYVGVTRAKQYVGVHHMIEPDEDYGEPSRFIEELGLTITEDSHEQAAVV